MASPSDLSSQSPRLATWEFPPNVPISTCQWVSIYFEVRLGALRYFAVLCFGVFKVLLNTVFCAYDRKNADDDNDGCNDNYDGNFDDNDDKK